MIPIVYFRSSSLNTWKFCQMQYLFEYVLGYTGLSNKKADKGTIVHKVMEILAECKVRHQNNPELLVYDNDLVPNVEIHRVLFEDEYIDKIIENVYNHYISVFTHHDWTPKDYKECNLWCWKAIEYRDRMFDPRLKNIVSPEVRFDFDIGEDWSKYEIGGQEISLRAKGTIDQVSDLSDEHGIVYEICDWKTGRRVDWATGEEKTQSKLFYDAQLRFYHLAAKRLYPHVQTFIITIFFINDGGPYTVHFTDDDIEQTNNMLKNRFNQIINCEKPKMVREERPSDLWKCRKLCHAGMNTFEGTHILPVIQDKYGKLSKRGEPMSMCEQVEHDIKKYGMDFVIKKYTHPDFTISNYKAPG